MISHFENAWGHLEVKTIDVAHGLDDDLGCQGSENESHGAAWT